MCKRNGFTWRGSARVLAALLAALLTSLPAWAGTMTIVDLPATGTDAAIGISTSKTYTHTFDFGSNAPVTINGVAMEQGPTASLSAVYTRTSIWGYGYTIDDTRRPVNIPVHAGNANTRADGSSHGLFLDFIYHSGGPVDQGTILTLSDLTAGATYSTRWYYRPYGASTGTARVITFKADGESNGIFRDTIELSIDAREGAHYLDYTFTADDTDVTIQFITHNNNQSAHIYGVTNELLRGSNAAYSPTPANKATDVFRGAMLSWKAGETAATHNVYFGTSAADVGAASVTTPLGVLASAGQKTTDFDPGRLELGRTYYWRVDEVNNAPDFTVFKGGVWSFTVEPFSYPIPRTGLTATASSASATTMGPEKTIDGSGLNASDQHSTTGDHMWLSDKDAVNPAWIQYAFDKIYKLDRMQVWNSNQLIEPMIGFGAKAVKVEYSTDGAAWATLGDFTFAQASGAATYTANTTIDFAGAAARFVKLTISSNWGGVVPQHGLSEVRFHFIPAAPSYPIPASGATGLDPHVALSWRPGREAGSHQVFLGIAAADLPLAATVSEAAYETDLGLGQTYYWKVVEVNEAKTPRSWEGPVWSFSTAKSVAVDDFESYNDLEGKGTRIYETWIDGWTNKSGSTVGYLQAPFAELYVFFDGKQSMPLHYDNTAGATYSEAERTFDEPQDWTRYGLKGLSLYFFGEPNNTGQLYLKINNTKVLYTGAAADLQIAAWLPWTIDLVATGANLQKVTKLAIGVEGAGAKGKLLIDEVCLFPTGPQLVTPADPGTTGLVAYYKLDGDAKDSAGAHHGTLAGHPQPFVVGKVGQAFNVTADLTYITIPYAADLALNTYTVSVWVKVSDKNGNRGILGTRFNGDNTFDVKVDAVRIHGDIGNGTAWLNSAADILTSKGGSLTTNVWHHIVYAVEPGITRMYLDGALASTVTYTGTPLFMKSGQELRIGCSYGTEYMRGTIDEVRIYNRALSAAEIASLAGRPGPIFQAP